MIRKRILQFIEYKGDTKYKFYQKTGFANGFLDKEGNIGSDKCEKICYKYPDLSLEWLITGKGEMLKKPAQPAPVQEVQPSNNDKYTDLLEKNIAIMEAQLKDKDKILALQEDKIADLERRLAFAEVKDKEEMSLKIKNQRKKNKEKDEIILD